MNAEQKLEQIKEARKIANDKYYEKHRDKMVAERDPCPHCKKFIIKGRLDRHIEMKHIPKPKKEKTKCPHCERDIFVDRMMQHLDNHIEQIRRENEKMMKKLESKNTV